MRELGLLFALQFLFFLVATIDIVAVANKKYRWVLATNAAIPMISYTMVKLIGESDRGLIGAFAVALGGMCAAPVGMWMTRRWGNEGA